jgi:hypothetical protein
MADKPSAPNISVADVIRQFKLDIYDKEVQSAATYSYLWIADQVGHLGLAVVLQFLGHDLHQILSRWIDLSWISANLFGLLLVCIATAYWEYSSYTHMLKQTTGRFSVNKRGLAANAITATGYMWGGAVIGYGFHQETGPSIEVMLLVLVVAVFPAVPWIRQKMIWQKAALPFLHRLANVRKTITSEAAAEVQTVVERSVPPDGEPRQVIIFGSIGTGRTSLAAGIGTEFAFRRRKVRYLTFDKFLELSSSTENFPGPKNITYWPWFDAQVLVIDDVSSALLPMQNTHIPVEIFERALIKQIKSNWDGLTNRDSVWVVGEVEDQALWIDLIERACESSQPAVIVELSVDNEA